MKRRNMISGTRSSALRLAVFGALLSHLSSLGCASEPSVPVSNAEQASLSAAPVFPTSSANEPNTPVSDASAPVVVVSDAGARVGMVPNAEMVVLGLRPKFQACYNHGLAIDGTLRGGVTTVVKVAPTGEVSSAEATLVTGLSPKVVECIRRAALSVRFEAPGGTGSTINIPVKFVQMGQ